MTFSRRDSVSLTRVGSLLSQPLFQPILPAKTIADDSLESRGETADLVVFAVLKTHVAEWLSTEHAV